MLDLDTGENGLVAGDDFHDQPHTLAEVITVDEAMVLLDKTSKPEILGVDRIAQRYKLGNIKIGGTLVFPLARVEEVGRLLAVHPLRGGPLEGEAAEAALAAFGERLAHVKRKVAEQAEFRSWRLADLMVIDEVQEALGGRTRERVYSLSDWRGGPMPTQRIGRTRVWNRQSVNAHKTAVAPESHAA